MRESTRISVCLQKRCGQLLDLLSWCQRKWTHIAPTQRWIAAKLGWSPRTLQRVVVALKALKLLEVVARYKRSALYRLLSPQAPLQMTFAFVDGGPVGDAELKPEPERKSKPALPAKIEGILQRAAGRIRRATNPAAYRQAIISCEFRLMKLRQGQTPLELVRKPAQFEYRPDPEADERALDELLGWIS